MNKILYNIISSLLTASIFAINLNVSAQDSTIAEPSVNLHYFANNNNVQYLLVQTVLKAGKKFDPLPKQVVKLFLDSISAENLITKTYTDKNGKAKVILPPGFKDKWNSNPKHKFIGVLEATSIEDERTTELEITGAKLILDTLNNEGVRSINVKMIAFENNDWRPARDVEMKIGIHRLGGILSAGEEEIYTTDSTGTVEVEFNKVSLPGDIKGNFVLAAKVDDNDQYGNLLVEKTVPWGVALKADKSFFDKRTLWSTRSRAPLWLLFMVYSIVIGVWGTILYLVLQIVKINKLGKAAIPGHSLS